MSVRKEKKIEAAFHFNPSQWKTYVEHRGRLRKASVGLARDVPSVLRSSLSCAFSSQFSSFSRRLRRICLWDRSEQEPHRHLNWLKTVAGAAQLISLKMVEQSGLSLPLMATSTQYIKPAPYFDFLRKLWLKHGGFKCKGLGIHLMAKLCCASTLVFSHVLVSAASCLQNSLMPSIFVLITIALRMDHSRQSDSLGGCQ